MQACVVFASQQGAACLASKTLGTSALNTPTRGSDAPKVRERDLLKKLVMEHEHAIRLLHRLQMCPQRRF